MSSTVPILSLPDQLKRSNRIADLLDRFQAKYGRQPTHLIRVPGRVNIIGEHIDYCGYGVLPMATQQDVVMAAAVNNDQLIRLTNLDNNQYPDFTCSINDVQCKQPPEWFHYFLCGFKGIVETRLESDYPGVDVAVTGTVPAGSGLSSSSAMVVCSALLAQISVDLHDKVASHKIDKLAMASLCARTERYIGTDGGGMDQAIVILAEEGSARLIEFVPKLSTEPVQLPDGVSFYISHSGVSINKAATSHYNQRVAETKLAAAIIAKKQGLARYKTGDQLYIVQQLAGKSIDEMITEVNQVFDKTKRFYTRQEIAEILGISVDDLTVSFLSKITDPIDEFKLYQRAQHVYSEAARVKRFKTTCETSKDVQLLGQLMSQSHASLRDLFECSHPKLDELVTAAVDAGALGSRLTGAGWGGCLVSLVPDQVADQFEQTMNKLSAFNCKSKPSGGAVIYTVG